MLSNLNERQCKLYLTLCQERMKRDGKKYILKRDGEYFLHVAFHKDEKKRTALRRETTGPRAKKNLQQYKQPHECRGLIFLPNPLKAPPSSLYDHADIVVLRRSFRKEYVRPGEAVSVP